jgi:hypothetical protein
LFPSVVWLFEKVKARRSFMYHPLKLIGLHDVSTNQRFVKLSYGFLSQMSNVTPVLFG